MDNKVDRIYSNEGNLPLIDLLPDKFHYVLDVGCGAGDNAGLIKASCPRSKIFGITHSVAEANLARRNMIDCWVFDVEDQIPKTIDFPQFDILIFSHILEHLRDPGEVLGRFTALLREGGEILIAVPNVLWWRMRFSFLLGQFEYATTGVLDDTHLRFFTYFTADRYLLAKSKNLQLIRKKVSGSVPLWLLRRHLLPRRWSDWIDEWGCRIWPNLFGYQILLQVVKWQGP